MSDRILTLFGEEFAPEPPKGPAKTRGKKKADDQATDDIKEEEQPQEPEIIPQPEEKAEQPAAEVIPQQSPAQELPEPEVIPQSAEAAIQPEEIKEEQPEAAAVAETGLQTKEEITTEPEDTGNETAEPEADEAPQPEDKTFDLPDDWKGDKNYYAIGEVADLFKVKTSHIRFWTNEFKLKVRTTRKGDRLYTPDQVRELKAIHHLVKERGFKISGAKAKMKAQNKMDIETVDLKQSLQQLRARLVAIKSRLS